MVGLLNDDLNRASLAYIEEFDLENQRGIGRDHAAGTTGSVGQIRWDDQFALATDFHARDAFIPSLDHPTCSEREAEGAAPVAAVEFLAAFQRSAVVDDNNLSWAAMALSPSFNSVMRSPLAVKTVSAVDGTAEGVGVGLLIVGSHGKSVGWDRSDRVQSFRWFGWMPLVLQSGRCGLGDGCRIRRCATVEGAISWLTSASRRQRRRRWS